jgi:hypothetical protein
MHPQDNFHMHRAAGIDKARAANGKAHQPCIIIDPDLLPKLPKWARVRSKNANGGRGGPAQRDLWRVDIKHVLNAQYGFPLPPDDAGSESLALLCHAAYAGDEDVEQRITRTAAMWLPEAPQAKIDALIDEVANRPRKLTKKIIGRELGLTQDLRMRPDVQAYSIWPVQYPRKKWLEDKRKKACARAAKSYAKRRKGEPLSKKAQCMDFLRKTLFEPTPAARIMRLAVALGLEKEGATQFGHPMRDACRELGVIKPKDGLRGGWIWSLPQADKHPETPYILEGDLFDANAPHFLEGDLFSTGKGGKPLRVENHVDQAERVGGRAASRKRRRGGGEGPVQADTAIESAASADRQREGGKAAPSAAAPQLQIAQRVSILNEAAIERGGTLQLQMIALQRAVLASPGIGWRVPARRWPIGGLTRRVGGHRPQ